MIEATLQVVGRWLPPLMLLALAGCQAKSDLEPVEGAECVGDGCQPATQMDVAVGETIQTDDAVATAAPILALEDTSSTFTEGDSALVLSPDTGALSYGVGITAPGDNPTSGSVSITTGFDSTEDVLTATGSGSVTVNYNPATGVLTLSGTDSAGTYEDVLKTVAYQNTDTGAPSTTSRVFTFSVTNSSGTDTETHTTAITAVNDAPVLVAASIADFTTTDENTTTSVLVSSLLSTAVTDPDSASATEGVAIHTATATNGAWYYNIAASCTTTGTWTAFPTVATATALLLQADDCVRFLPNSENAGSGTIEFYAWDTTTGSAGSTADVTTRGNATAFSSTGGDSAITTTAVNDAPVLTAASIADFSSITENETTNSTVVSTLLSTGVTDVDTGAVEGVAIHTTSATNGTWYYSTDCSTYTVFPSVSGTGALLLHSDDCLRFLPNGENSGSGSISFYAWDRSDGNSAGSTTSVASRGNATAFSTSDDSSTITVTAVNDAPVLVSASIDDFATITEDNTSNATLVSDLLDSAVSDVDTGATEGVAIYSTSATNGSWYYNTSATCSSSGTWTVFPAVTTSAALLLHSDDCVRFLPNGENAGSGSITFYAWDRSDSGSAGGTASVTSTGGNTAFSSTAGTSDITTTAANDAPVLVAATIADFATVSEDSSAGTATLVSTLLSTGVTDVDTGAVEGVAIYSESSTYGKWQYNTDASCSSAGTWTDLPTVTTSAAQLLAADDCLRYVPDNQNGGAASITFYAWDTTSGTAGSTASVTSTGTTTAFSSIAGTSDITITAVNDAPVLTGTVDNFATITEDNDTNSTLVSDLLDNTVSDVDSGAVEGVAIYSTTADSGSKWQYSTASDCSTNSSATFSDFPAVTTSAALLLGSDDCIRYKSKGKNAETGSITYYAWDQSAGTLASTASVTSTGGTTAFSSTGGTSSISVTAQNDAPTVTTSVSLSLTGTDEDTTSTGMTVAAILASGSGDPISDDDTTAVEGIAIYSETSGGTWYYSTNGGTSYTALPSVSSAAALLLAANNANNMIRYVPDNQNGETATLSFYAWDQTTGTDGSTASVSSRGGTTAFSSSGTSASITVTSVNDAPVMVDASIDDFDDITEDSTSNATLVSDLLDSGVTDVDTGAAEGIAIYSTSATNGSWYYSTNCSTYTVFPSVSSAAALLLNSDDCIRFLPNEQNSGTGSISFNAWDRSTGTAGSTGSLASTGTTTAFSTITSSSSITVTAVNDAPVLTAASVQDFSSITEDDTTNVTLVSALLSTSASDVDTSAVEGIAIYAETSNGSWYYNTSASCSTSGTWTVFPTVTASAALLLAEDDCIRYDPDDQNAETATISFYAWDQTTGAAGSTASVGTRGNTTAFSSTGDGSSITVTAVNDAPVLVDASIDEFDDITEDNSTNSTLVSDLLDSGVSDVDTGAVEGIAITSISSGNGTWQYSTNCSSYTAIGTVTTSSALILDSDDCLRFVPDGLNTDSASVTFYAWDRSDSNTAGNKVAATSTGTTTAFSSLSSTATLTVTAVNDAPTLTSASLQNFTTITEDDTTNSTLVSALLSSAQDDVDSGAVEGIAIYAETSNGSWYYATDASCSSFSVFPTVTTSAALLLAADDCIRYDPDDKNGETATITYYAWDRSSGTGGSTASVTSTGNTTAFSTSAGTSSIIVTSVNDAPVVATSVSLSLGSTDEDTTSTGKTITQILASGSSDPVSDVDTGAVEGVAVFSVSGNGTWQYSTDGGSSYSDLSVSSSAARLLSTSSSNLIRYVPDNKNSETPSISFYAWDRTSGTDGSTANVSSSLSRGSTNPFSSDGTTASLTVTAVNDAPVLNLTSYTLTTITEDASATYLVSAFLDSGATDEISDVDNSASEGIAIYASNKSNGTWQYNTASSCTSSGTWTAFPTVSSSGALLLAADDCVRFVPDAKNSDTVDFSFYAWDQTNGSAGTASTSVASRGNTTAFSTASGSVSLNVTAVNDAPVLDTSKSPALTSITEDNIACSLNLISTLVGAGVSDVDSGAVYGIAVYSDTSNGTWQYSTDGTIKTSLPTVSSTSALLLNSDDYLCYIPDEMNGETASLSFYVWDRTNTSSGSIEAGYNVDVSNRGTTYPYSTNGDTITITVTSVNDKPTASITYDVVVSGGTQTLTLSADGDYATPASTTSPNNNPNAPDPSVDVDSTEDVCEWKWTYVSGQLVSLGLDATCTKQDPGNNGGSDDCVDPSYVATGSTVWQLEVRSATGGNCSLTGEWSDPVKLEVKLENIDPVADAGSDMDIPIGAPIPLDGTGSSDSDGTIDTYAWTVSTTDDLPPGLADGTDSNGDPYVTIDDPSSVTPNITVSETFISGLGSTTGQLTVTLTVTDNAGDSVSDSVTLSICGGYFADEDGDTYGNPALYYVKCSGVGAVPAGYIKQDTTVDTTTWTDFDCLDTDEITDGETTIEAEDIGNIISWYADDDADGYGDPAERYTAGGDCVTDQPTSHVLNLEDCNDDDGPYMTGAGEELSPSEQNPDTRWYIDIDGDLYGADGTSNTIYIVPGLDDDDNDTMCYCSATSKCGTLSNCVSYSSSSGSTTVSSVCEPYDNDDPVNEDCQIPSQITQCEDPSNPDALAAGEKYFNPDEDGDDAPDYVDEFEHTLLSFWVVDNGDCNEAAVGANEDADERCDPVDLDENCDGYADDDQPNKSIISNVFEFYKDADNDGFGEENDVEASCSAADESGRRSYQFHTITAEADPANNYYAYIDSEDTSNNCYCQDSAGTLCFDIDGAECTPASIPALQEMDAEEGEVDCMCYREDCSGTCLTLAHSVCTPDPDAVCETSEDFVNPGWFTDSDENYYFDQFDCDDTDKTVYPGAEEKCDGQLNDCFVESGDTPDDEIDYDNDDYVACGYTTGWAGGSGSEPNVGTDCSPDDKRVYPSAEEYCDGQFNDCDLWVDKYVDATGTCFCDASTCGGSDAFCVDSTGNTCTPTTTVTSTQVYADNDGDCFCPSSTLTGLCVDGEGIACDPDGSSGATTSYTFAALDSDEEICYCADASSADCINGDGRSCTPAGTPVSMLSYMDCAPSGDTMSSGAPTDETDNDEDCYVECYDGTTSWKGGDALLGDTCAGPKPNKGEDCSDEDDTIYPGALELCDGQLNNCNTASLPTNEVDNDSDGYVDCTYDADTWSGSGSVIGGDDCDDAYILTYPGANESCDGKFNDCDHFLLEDYKGVVGTGCFCDSSSGAATSCVNTAGETCDPDADNDGDIDSYLLTTTTIGATTYGSAAYTASTACYCPTSDCQVDQDFDDNSDCYTAAGAVCSIESLDADEDGYADNCIQEPIDPGTGTAFTRSSPTGFAFSNSTTGSTDKKYTPPGEYDDDGDKYVECEDYASSTWKGKNVLGGSDCDDSYNLTFAGATERCDGVYNNCSDLGYDEDSAPADELDDDEDNFVDCSPANGVTWKGDTKPNPYFTATSTTNFYYYTDETGSCFCSTATGPSADGLTWTCGATCVTATGSSCSATDFDGDGTKECVSTGGYKDCDDADAKVYPDAPKACDGQYNDCTASDYSATASPTDETDNDGDGYAECVGLDDTDCDDTDATRFPGANEVCDGQFNDCVHFLLSDFEGATTTGCSCTTSDGATGGSVCTTDVGALCEPTDSNSDGFADNFVNIADSGSSYDSVEVACYCPSSDCLVDLDDDSLSDCFDPAGTRCEIEDIDQDEDGYADDCIANALNPNAAASGDLLAHDMTGISGWWTLSSLNTDITAPPSEVDHDDDRYVECEYVKETWQGASNVKGGEDCDDLSSWARYVTPDPAVNEYCDGVFNDCNDPDYDASSAPADELDDDGDGYVECTKETAANGAWKRPETDPSRYADEDGDCFCNSRGADNLCSGTCLDADGATCTPTDANGDTFTTCYDAGGFVDCDDTDGTVYPAADEICDGQYNNCSSASYTATGAPTNETDKDGDKYVVCDAVYGTATCLCSDDDEDYSDCAAPDGSPCTHEEAPSLLWNGVADAPDGGSDCDDSTSTGLTRYPGAPEECDGLFNDCEHFLLSDFEGAIGTGCYCKSEDGSFTTSGGGSCKTLNDSGVPVSCTPVDVDGDKVMDNFVGVETTLGVTDYSSEDLGENPCYCPTADCLVDSDADNLSDCYDLNGDRCEIEDIDTDGNGFADGCITNPLNVDRSPLSKDMDLPFNDETSSSVTPADNAPPTEVDHDGDRRVECEYVEETWEGKSNVKAGLDCDDLSDWAYYVFPGAPEYCDGVFNNCDTAGYDANGAPDDELDADEDGFVQCLPDDGIKWARPETDPNPIFNEQGSDYLSTEVYFSYYVDSDGDCYCPSQVSASDAACDPDNCKDASGVTCTPTEGDCTAVGGYGDCNDDPKDGGATTHVAAVEICDGQYNDCRDQTWTEGDSSTWPSNDDPENVPEEERDDDGDSFVDCDSWSTDTWLGYGEVTVTGGDDCNDEDATIFPGATEECDGIFNDCDDVLLQEYTGVVTESGCYCNDDCDAGSCRDSSGAPCAATDALDADGEPGSDGKVDVCATMTAPVTIGGVEFTTVEVSYYCEYSDCLYDPDGDGDANCVTPEGVHAPSIPNFTNANYADDCALSGVEPVTYDFDSPSEETDNDDDGYVECDYNSATWLAKIHPTGGNDCDDVDDTVYPTAPESCDGQYNDCDSPSGYSNVTAPADETDDDGDGWVECERQVSAPWNPAELNVTEYEPNTWFGSADSGCFCPSQQSCEDEIDGYVGDATIVESVAQCVDAGLNACVPLDCDDTAVPGDPDGAFNPIRSVEMYDCDDTLADVHPASSPLDAGLACAEDSDFDDYADEAPTSAAAVAGTDCMDDSWGVHPNQPESCEQVAPQIDTDCNGDTNSSENFDNLEGWDEDVHPEVHVDEDLDGYGDESLAAIEACEVAPGYSENDRDCDDRDEDIHPNAPEFCDGVDQDCDDAIDEATPKDPLNPDDSGCISSYKDEDGDGYGDITEELCLCAPENGSNPTYEGVSYTVFYGDCYDGVDFGTTIKPLTCEDGFDNDGDGDADEKDEDCIQGFTEVNASGDEKEERFEILDGHDNDCDGYVPAVELDCDDDRSLPMLPVEAGNGSRPDTFESAKDLGLRFCDQVSESDTIQLSCWNTTLTLSCDEVEASVDPDGDITTTGTGLWMLPLVDGAFDGRYDGGARIYTSEAAPSQGNCSTGEDTLGNQYSDCEDHCSSRCESSLGQTAEVCDGLDNNCSEVDPGTDDDGIPDSLDPDVTIPGTVSPTEIDLDDDSFYECEAFPRNRNETQYSTASCGDQFASGDQTNDCNSLCSLTNPDATEACDGFANTCDEAAEPEGLDDDRDDLRTCGAWAGDSELEEDVFVVVWLRDVDWARRGSEPKVLSRPSVAAPPAPPAADAGSAADTDAGEDTDAPEADTAEDTGAAPPPPPAAATADAKDEDTAAGTDVVELADMVPLILPRAAANGSGIVTCDVELYQQLAYLLGEERLAEAMDPESTEDPNQILVEACEREDGFCTVVQFNLGEDVDERTYEEIIGTSGEFTGDCEDHPEQWIARAMWQHARILEARETVVEWECQRLYGKSCSNVVVGESEAADTTMVDGWQDAMPNAAQWLSNDSAWWKEIGVDRFSTTSAHTETLLTCWGDPRGVEEEDNDISDKTGGDCDDASRDSHRDNPEGPDDLIGLYLGEPADCSTCLDGFDNNCDGNVDCADPACARCFIGQGVGCSRGEDAPCAQAGCAAGATGGSALLDRMFSAAVLALFAVLYRRRDRR